jgi:aryl-alcohol dehydrogenase-like predicted oxidoreductase
MQTVTIGRTGLVVRKDVFGVLPLQRRTMEEALPILTKALDAGINFFDTARSYTDSEEKIGRALSKRRSDFVLATKTPAKDAAGFWQDLETSLTLLKTDHIDLYQFHNPETCPRPGDGSGLYEAMLEAQQQGKVRFIGITNHRMKVAEEASESGLYDTLQFPQSYLSGITELALPRRCAEAGMGYIAMKALGGGLLTDFDAAHAWMQGRDNVVPIWGIQWETELDQLLALRDRPLGLTAQQSARIKRDQAELQGEFCRSCGYCLPCPENILIYNCARISQLIRRMPPAQWLTPAWQAEMAKIPHCRHCGTCASRCPYGLDPPALLEKNYRDYQHFLAKGVSSGRC